MCAPSCTYANLPCGNEPKQLTTSMPPSNHDARCACGGWAMARGIGMRGRRLAAGGLAMGLAVGVGTAVAMPLLANSTGGAFSFIGGGDANATTDNYGFIGGGANNTAGN